MSSSLSGRQFGLFDNPVGAFSLESGPRPGITGSRWQASTSEVREWAASSGFQIDPDGAIPGPAIAAYNQTHPDRPY